MRVAKKSKPHARLNDFHPEQGNAKELRKAKVVAMESILSQRPRSPRPLESVITVCTSSRR
jgi:hypothetical protein